MTGKNSRSGNPAKREQASAAAPSKTSADKPMAIYHEMLAKETFEDTAEMLFQMVRDCAAKHPGHPRALYLDVEKHRNKAGGFDQDAYELMTHFIHGYLMQWLSETHTPLGAYVNHDQNEDLPDGLDIVAGGAPDERAELLRASAAMGPIYDSETGELVDTDGNRRPYKS